MEIPSTSKCPTAGRSDDVEGSVRDGVRLDEKWEYKRIHQGTSRCGPAWARKFYT